jgi:hypothetical protein
MADPVSRWTRSQFPPANKKPENELGGSLGRTALHFNLDQTTEFVVGLAHDTDNYDTAELFAFGIRYLLGGFRIDFCRIGKWVESSEGHCQLEPIDEHCDLER